MRRALLLFSLAFCLLLASSFTAFSAPPNHFDSNNEAWQQSQVDIKTSSYQYEYYWPTGDALWQSENGNGFIYLESTSLARPRAYNAMVTGADAQMGNLNGKTLVVDLKRMGADFKTLAGSEPTVRWVITDADVVQTYTGTWYVSKLAVSPQLNQLTGEWETQEIEMKPENFFLWPWGLTGNQAASFDEVMVNYKQVGLSIISSAPDNAAFGWGPADGNVKYTLPDYGGFSSVAGTNSILAIDNFGTAPDQTLDINKAGSGSGTVTSTPAGIDCGTDCAKDYPYNTAVTLTATPDTGSQFAGWNGDCDVNGKLIMDADKTCTATFTLTDDGDGVSADIENAAPNNGDGNNDGIKDSIQRNVTSLPAAAGNGYITLVTTGTCKQNLEVQTFIPDPADPDYEYPFGLVGFKLQCSTANIKIYFHESSDLNGFTYRKYGPIAPDFTTPEWYDLPGVNFGTGTIDKKVTAYAEFSLTDGALGDDTGVDGWIIDQGGPGFPAIAPAPSAIPTLNEWGMIIFALLAGFIAVRQIRRNGHDIGNA